MIDLAMRTKGEVLETAGGGTDKTCETPFSSVSSVGVQPLFEKYDVYNAALEAA